MSQTQKTFCAEVIEDTTRIGSFSQNIMAKPLSLLFGTFFSPRIITAQVLVNGNIVYSSEQKF